jgi:hypothetical protein
MPTPCSTRMLAALVIALSSACSGESLAPGTLGEEYVLASVANDPLPTTLYTTSSASLHIISQSIRFGPKGAGSITETTEMVPHSASEASEGPKQRTYGIHWVEREGRVEVNFDCSSGTADCLPGPHLIGQIEGNTIQATWGPGLSGRAPLRYEVVPASP